jgi:DNA-directed RNA polymerase subunit RPC12/RpoP
VPKGYPVELRKGQRIGYWKVTGEQYAVKRMLYVPCICTKCKREFKVNKSNLTNGCTRSCRECGYKLRELNRTNN